MRGLTPARVYDISARTVEEGLNRRGARDLVDRRNSDATATRWLNEVEIRVKL